MTITVTTVCIGRAQYSLQVIHKDKLRNFLTDKSLIANNLQRIEVTKMQGYSLFNYRNSIEPPAGIEPATFALRVREIAVLSVP